MLVVVSLLAAVFSAALGDPLVRVASAVEEGSLQHCRDAGLHVCRFYIDPNDARITQVGADLRLNGTQQPYQDHNGDFTPSNKSMSCDSYITGPEDGTGLDEEASVIKWGEVSPYIINGIWVFKRGSDLLPGSGDTLVMQISFNDTQHQSAVSGTFYLISPSARFWRVDLTCVPGNYHALTTVTPLPTTLPATPSTIMSTTTDTTTTAPANLEGGGVAGIVIGVLLLLAGLVVLLVVGRYFYRRNLVTRDVQAFETDVQEDFMAVARAALRENRPRTNAGYSDFDI